MAHGTVGPPFDQFLATAEAVAQARPEVDLEMAREVFHEAATLLHNGLALDGLDEHDASAVVAGLCVDLVAEDPGAAVRARSRATVQAPGDPGNNQNLRYRIPRGTYELPADVSFSPDETTLLNLAAMVWREGSLSAESRRALLKLRSLGVTADEPVIGYAPRVRVRDAAFEPLSAALEKRAWVRFSYLKPGENEARGTARA